VKQDGGIGPAAKKRLQRAQIKLNVIPVIPGLIKNPVFGGK